MYYPGFLVLRVGAHQNVLREDEDRRQVREPAEGRTDRLALRPVPDGKRLPCVRCCDPRTDILFEEHP